MQKVVIVGDSKLINKRTVGDRLKYYSTGNLVKSIQYKALRGNFDNPRGNDYKKYSKKQFDADASELVEWCENFGVTTIATTSPKFWQFATKHRKFMEAIDAGTVLDGTGTLTGLTIVPIVNANMLYVKPQFAIKLTNSVRVLQNVVAGTHTNTALTIGNVTTNVVTDIVEMETLLNKLVLTNLATFDIESTGLVLGRDRIITIAIATSTTVGYAFPLCEEYWKEIDPVNYVSLNIEARRLMEEFFLVYRGVQVWHNHIFDVPFVLRDILKIQPHENKRINDTLNFMNLCDTMILKYLCVNSVGRVSLKLKDELFSIYGEYDKALDQSNLLAYSYYDVAKYNVYDVTGTFEVYERYRTLVTKEDQEDILQKYYKPSMTTLLKLKCKGFVIDTGGVTEARTRLDELVATKQEFINKSVYTEIAVDLLKVAASTKYNETHVKQKLPSDFDIEFNPRSPKHKEALLIQALLYHTDEKTKTGNISLGKEVLATFIGEEQDVEKVELLTAVQDFLTTSKVSSTFLKAFDTLTVPAGDTTMRLHPDIKLTGTISGRTSSANPNLQNLPSGSEYGKLIKSLAPAPKGFIFAGSDYNALEDFVIAEYTGDEVKVKVLLEGYDSHSLYLASYIPDTLKDMGLPFGRAITKEESFLIKENAKELRDGHKCVTFALAYNGTEHTVARSLGISLEEAKTIVDNYAQLHYKIKDYQREATLTAKKLGYYMTPLGLKVRASELNGTDTESIARSGTNALSQGPAGMIMINAISKIQQRIEEAGLDEDIVIINTIHDACYAYVREDPSIIKWYNDNLIECMVEDYKTDQVLKLRANLDIGYSWDTQIELTNNAQLAEIKRILVEAKGKINETTTEDKNP